MVLVPFIFLRSLYFTFESNFMFKHCFHSLKRALLQNFEDVLQNLQKYHNTHVRKSYCQNGNRKFRIKTISASAVFIRQNVSSWLLKREIVLNLLMETRSSLYLTYSIKFNIMPSLIPLKIIWYVSARNFSFQIYFKSRNMLVSEAAVQRCF